MCMRRGKWSFAIRAAKEKEPVSTFLPSYLILIPSFHHAPLKRTLYYLYTTDTFTLTCSRRPLPPYSCWFSCRQPVANRRHWTTTVWRKTPWTSSLPRSALRSSAWSGQPSAALCPPWLVTWGPPSVTPSPPQWPAVSVRFVRCKTGTIVEEIPRHLW